MCIFINVCVYVCMYVNTDVKELYILQDKTFFTLLSESLNMPVQPKTKKFNRINHADVAEDTQKRCCTAGKLLS